MTSQKLSYRTALCALSFSLFAASGCSATTSSTAATSFRWDRVNIAGGGMNTGVLVHPANPDLIYARQDVSGLLRWDKASQCWIQLLDWMPVAWKNTKGCAGFAVDTTAGRDVARQNVIYAAFGGWLNPSQNSREGNGVFRSLDRGRNWTKIWDGEIVDLGKDVYLDRAYAFGSNTSTRMAGENMAVDPFNPNVLWVGTNTQGLWRSENARAAKPIFAKVTNAPQGFWRSAWNAAGIRSVLLDARGGFVGEGASKRARIVVLGLPKPPADQQKEMSPETRTGVCVSLDGGATWKWLDGANAPDSPCRMALGPRAGTFFVTNSNGRDDGLRFYDGKNWSVVKGTEKNTFSGLATSPRGVIVAGGNDKATWVSRDWGATWAQRKANSGATFLKINWATPGFVYPGTPAYALDARTNRAFFGDSFGVHTTSDVLASTMKWTPMLKGYETTVVWSISSPPIGPRLYATMADVNGFAWDDVTQTPQKQLFESVYPNDSGGPPGKEDWGIGDSACSDIQWAPSKPQNQVVLRSTWKGYYSPYARLYRTADAGKTWQGFPAPPPNETGAPDYAQAAGAAKIAISCDDPNRMVYVRPYSFPVYTQNGFDGASIAWKPSNGVNFSFKDVFPYHVSGIRLSADATNGKRFYLSNRANGGTQIWVSDDGGANWLLPATQQLPSAGDDFLLATTRGAEGKGELWIGANANGLFRSKDGACTFERVAPKTVSFAKAIAWGKPQSGKQTPTGYLAGTVNGRDGVFYSLDSGATWNAMTIDGQPLVGGATINDMRADGRVWGRVYIATAGTGVLYSTATSSVTTFRVATPSATTP